MFELEVHPTDVRLFIFNMNSQLAVPPAEEKYESDASEGYDGPPPAYRRNSESSTERSLYDEKDEALLPSQSPSGTVREYGWYHPKVMTRGLVITDSATSTEAAKMPLYYVEVSEFALKKPDIILHAVPSTTGATNDLDQLASTGESGPVIGVGHLPKLSRHYKIGLGDPATSAMLTWVEIHNPNKLYHGEYQFSLNGKSYSWKRTHDPAAGVEGGNARRKVTRNSFQLTESLTNEVVAVFLDNKFKSWKKKGKLRVFKDLEGNSTESKQLKLAVLLSIAAILEKARRRSQYRHSQGGGVGGC